MKYINKLLLLALIIGFVACDTNLDLQENPNAVTPDNASVADLYNQIQLHFGSTFFQVQGQSGSLARMYHMGTFTYQAATGPGTFDFLWQRAYADMFPDIDALLNLTEPIGLDIQSGSVKVMKAYALMAMVDHFGNIPLSEAGQGTDIISPRADDGAAVYAAAVALGDGSFTIDEIAIANPKSDEVIVQIKAAALCHTDYDSLTWGKPIVLGHEGAGVVYKVGSEVEDLGVGDRVILNWATPCMKCFQCQEGNQHICENNSPVTAGGNGYTPGHAHLEGSLWKGQPIERSFNVGTLSEYALVKSSACVKLKAEMPMPSASIISCGVMTGYGSAVNTAKVTPGSSAVVLGTGGVGLNVIQGARISGAEKIIAIDINPQRLEMAKQFGATHGILADKDDIGLLRAAEAVKALCDGRGADFAFECTAIPVLGAAPLAMIRNAGTAVQVSGIEEEIQIDMNLFEWDKIYINPLYGKCRPQIDFPKLVNLYNAMLDNGHLALNRVSQMEYKWYVKKNLDKVITCLR